jgi:hypothetical protein
MTRLSQEWLTGKTLMGRKLGPAIGLGTLPGLVHCVEMALGRGTVECEININLLEKPEDKRFNIFATQFYALEYLE